MTDARATVTIFLPAGYATGNEFAADCGFEIAPVQGCDAESAIVRAALEECANRCRYDGDLFHDQGNISRRDASWKASDMAIAALSPDPGTVAVASADREGRPFCSCKASQRDGQHMAWCPAISSTHRESAT